MRCLAEFTEDLLEFADERFPICPPLLRGPGDAAAALKGPEPIVMAILEKEEWVGEFLAHCAETRLGVLRHLHSIIPSWFGTYVAGGYPSKLWAARPVSYYQDDFAALLNPSLFAEALLPLARMTEPIAEIHFIHLHSSCLYMLDTVLGDDTFSVIEVNLDHPDSGPALSECVPALRNIQDAGRPLLFALPYRLLQAPGVGDQARFSQQVHQFMDGRLLLCGGQRHLDRLGRENVKDVHGGSNLRQAFPGRLTESIRLFRNVPLLYGTGVRGITHSSRHLREDKGPIR